MIKILGFAPDADPTSLGVLTECTNVIPTIGGFRGAPTSVSVGAATLAAACRGAVLATELTGTRRLIAGTSAALYELAATTWTDRSRAGAPAYALGVDDRWSIVQYANTTLAVTPSAVVQRALPAAAFANVAGSPQAKIIEVAAGFAVVFNTSSFVDEWYCSAYLDPTDWVTSVTTQCVKGRLIGSPGPITAALRFGDNIVAYKASSMYLGQASGAPEAWRWTQVSTDVGCVGINAVVDTSIGHVFVGVDGLYVFDGTRPRPLDVGLVREWLAAEMAGGYKDKTQLLLDRDNGLVWAYYAGNSDSGAVNRCLVVDIGGGRFGRANSTIQAVLSYSRGEFTYDSGTPLVTTYDAGTPAISFDSAFWIGNAVTPAIFNGSNILQTLTGVCGAASFTTGDVGDDEGHRMCTELRVRYTTSPTTSVATGFTKNQAGAPVSVGSSGTQVDGKHNLRQTARWHRFTVATTGNFEVTAFRPKFIEAGSR